MSTLLQMRGITKRFSGVLANNQIDFEVERGEVHALLGENGAGKTTLMNILYGFYRPDAGEISFDGRPVNLRSPRDAIDIGIGMVHQSFQLVPTLSVAHNVILGMRSPREPFYDSGQAERRIRELSTHYGLGVDPTAKVWQLAAGIQQRVEIIKALYRQAKLLILDEPTSVLTPQEAQKLFAVLCTLTAEGRSVVFISHKLDEVMQVSNRITVLRDGNVIATVRPDETSPRQLAHMMVGRELKPLMAKVRTEERPGMLQLDSVSALNDRGLPALKDVTLTVRGGEIVGIAGIAGNGQSELAEVITGLRPLTAGRVSIDGTDLTNRPPSEIIQRGVAYIPEKPRQTAVFMDFALEQNAILKSHRSAPLAKRGFLKARQIREYAHDLMACFDVRASGPHALARQLSGGNLQKFVLGRELSRQPKLIVAAQPTAGVDVGATAAIRERLLAERANGQAILLISADLDEVLSLSDRVAVMYQGEIVGEMQGDRVDIQELGLMMAGAKRAGVATPA